MELDPRREVNQLKEQLAQFQQQNTELENKLSETTRNYEQVAGYNEALSQDNERLKKENLQLSQIVNDKNMEVMRLTEKTENQRDFILKLEEKYVKIESNIEVYEQ